MSGRVSFMFAQQPTEPDAILPFGQLAVDVGAARLWLGQSLRIESHPALAYLAGSGCRLSVGMSVGLAVLRHPYDAALQARSLARLMGHPVAIGYGSAYPSYVTGLLGHPYPKPASFIGSYVDIARRLAANEAVSCDDEFFSVHTRLPPMQTPKVEMGAGVLRPTMARIAGRTCDLAMTWLTPLNYLEEVVKPQLAAGARGVQPVPRIVSVVHAAVQRKGRSPNLLAQHGSMGHLSAAHYTDMLRRAGLDVDASDPIAGARELVQAGIYVYGDAAHIADEIARYHALGVDEVVINPASVALMYGVEAALEDIAEIFAAVNARRARGVENSGTTETAEATQATEKEVFHVPAPALARAAGHDLVG